MDGVDGDGGSCCCRMACRLSHSSGDEVKVLDRRGLRGGRRGGGRSGSAHDSEEAAAAVARFFGGAGGAGVKPHEPWDVCELADRCDGWRVVGTVLGSLDDEAREADEWDDILDRRDEPARDHLAAHVPVSFLAGRKPPPLTRGGDDDDDDISGMAWWWCGGGGGVSSETNVDISLRILCVWGRRMKGNPQELAALAGITGEKKQKHKQTACRRERDVQAVALRVGGC